ncbi:MAG: DUF1573 domain-containing protein [Bacteroidota bacterium]|nr:DUF1573 domain-containing protein [Bacteroidota bacterium]
MKFFLLLIAAATTIISCGSNEVNSAENSVSAIKTVTDEEKSASLEDEANLTEIEWKDSTFQNLGKIKEGQIVEIAWNFKNVGTKPLIIANTSASCGCTVAEKPEAPIAVGKDGVIKAKFDSNGRQGSQRKDVYVVANTSGGKEHHLSFMLEVEKK